MLVDVVEARPLGGYRVHLRFEDGVEADLDLGELIRFEGVFVPLRDPARFAELRVHPELGNIYWPGGAGSRPRRSLRTRYRQAHRREPLRVAHGPVGHRGSETKFGLATIRLNAALAARLWDSDLMGRAVSSGGV